MQFHTDNINREDSLILSRLLPQGAEEALYWWTAHGLLWDQLPDPFLSFVLPKFTGRYNVVESS